MTDPLQTVVVPCGGRGTRLAPAIGDLPKVLAPVGAHPLLRHLLVDLAKHGAAQVLLLAGEGGEQVRQAAEKLAPPGLRVHTLVEDRPLGTAGALGNAAERLPERFVLTFGDVYTALDWRRFADRARERGGLATLVVHRSSHPEDSDLVALDDAHRIVGWTSPEQRHGAAVGAAALGNAAVMALSRDVLQRIPADRPSDLSRDVLPPLVDARAPVFGYLTSEYVRDLGTPGRLGAIDADHRAGRTRLRAELVLLDRDGVLSDGEQQLVDRPERMRLLPGAAAGVRELNRAGIRVAVVTNQAVVARGHCSPETLERIHARMSELLGADGARLDSVHHCPHHPQTHWPAGRPDLRGPCRCRKPSTGMVEQALTKHSVPAWRSVLIGDATIDLQTAHNAGLPGIALDTGKACADGEYPARAVWRFRDLVEAARWLSGA